MERFHPQGSGSSLVAYGQSIFLTRKWGIRPSLHSPLVSYKHARRKSKKKWFQQMFLMIQNEFLTDRNSGLWLVESFELGWWGTPHQDLSTHPASLSTGMIGALSPQKCPENCWQSKFGKAGKRNPFDKPWFKAQA